MQTLLDVLNRFESIFLLKFNILFNCLLLLIDKFGDLLSNFLSMLLSCLEACFYVPVSVLDCLFFDPDHLLFLKAITVEIIIDVLELVIQHDIELFFSLVNDVVEFIFEGRHFGLILLNLLVFAHFNVLLDA